MDIQQIIQGIKSFGLSQTEIAQKIGTSQALVSRWENGEAPDSANAVLKLQALSKTLNRKRKAS